MTDKRKQKQGSGTTTAVNPAPATQDRKPPKALPEAPPDDGPTTGAINPITAENDDPALNRDNDRGTRRPH